MNFFLNAIRGNPRVGGQLGVLEKGTPNYLRTVSLIAPVVPKTGGSFNFNPQYPTVGVFHLAQVT